MRSGANPYNNEAGLIDKYIGTAYDNVKIVADAIAKVQHVSENMEAVYNFAATQAAMEAFTENPDFLTWLEDNKDTLDDLSGLLASLVQDYAPLAGAEFTGFVKFGANGVGIRHVHLSDFSPVIGSTNIWPHGVNPTKIVGISGTIIDLNGNVQALTSESANVKIWCEAINLRMQVDAEAEDFGNRPFNVILTIIE